MAVTISDVYIENSPVAWMYGGSEVRYTRVTSPGCDSTYFETAKYPEFSENSTRRATFDNWPRGKHQTPSQLAQAGFFYAGSGDCTRCFYCGVGLRNWLQGDLPWKEHARWSPMCDFLRLMKGDNFIAQAEEIVEDTQFTEEFLWNTAPDRPDKDAIVESVLLKPCASSLILLGFSMNIIKRAVKTVLAESDWNEWQVTTSRLAEVVLDITEEDDCTKQSPGRSEYVREEGMLEEHFAEPTTIVSERRQLLEENEALRLQRTCKVCLQNEVSVVCLPCGHLAMCADCSLRTDHCGVCRVPIQGRVRAYM